MARLRCRTDITNIQLFTFYHILPKIFLYFLKTLLQTWIIKSLIFPVKNLKEEKHDKKKKQINAHQSLLYYSYSTGNSSLESPSQMRMETDWVNQQKQLSRQLLRWLYQGSLWLLLAWVRTSSVIYSSWL